MLVASWFIGMCLNIVLYCLLFCRFTGCDKFKINRKVIMFCLISCICYYFFIKLSIVFSRPLFIHILIFIGLVFTYKCNLIKTLITELCIFVIFSISELIYGFIIIALFDLRINEILKVWYIYLISNIIIIVISYLISKLYIVKIIINNIIKWYDKNEKHSNILLLAFTISIFIFFLYNNFLSFLPRYFLLVTNVFSIGVIYFIINYFKEKSINNRIISEYDQLLKYVQKYEKIVEDKSKSQHEYKNQLVLLKGLISKSNKKALNYLDDLNKELNEDIDVELLKKLKYLPSGGLKGLIYYKIEEMYDKRINVFVDVSSELEKLNDDDRIDKNLKDLSKIIGVYIDNAIEACIDSIEKFIILEVYLLDDELVFSISNTYSNIIEVSKVDHEGYTTKGEGKGYGLSLVKDILGKNKFLRQERELNGKYYVQKLYIKK